MGKATYDFLSFFDYEMINIRFFKEWQRDRKRVINSRSSACCAVCVRGRREKPGPRSRPDKVGIGGGLVP